MTTDRQLQVYARFDADIRARLRPLVTDALIAEHAARPLGPHSDALARLLNYFRRAPIPGKYVVITAQPWREYRIGVLPGGRGQDVTLLDDEVHPTEEAALHAIFLRRVQDLRTGA